MLQANSSVGLSLRGKGPASCILSGINPVCLQEAGSSPAGQGRDTDFTALGVQSAG